MSRFVCMHRKLCDQANEDNGHGIGSRAHITIRNEFTQIQIIIDTKHRNTVLTCQQNRRYCSKCRKTEKKNVICVVVKPTVSCRTVTV